MARSKPLVHSFPYDAQMNNGDYVKSIVRKITKNEKKRRPDAFQLSVSIDDSDMKELAGVCGMDISLRTNVPFAGVVVPQATVSAPEHVTPAA